MCSLKGPKRGQRDHKWLKWLVEESMKKRLINGSMAHKDTGEHETDAEEDYKEAKQDMI